MKRSMELALSLALLLGIGLVTSGSGQSNSKADERMGRARVDGAQMHAMPGIDNEAGTQVMHSMGGHHEHMGPHMKMTALRSPKPGDQERAQQVVDTARKVFERYKDYRTALADGFEMPFDRMDTMVPSSPHKQYHFNNFQNAREAAMHFHPEKPTSLLYERAGDDYKLVGLMYTVPKGAKEDALDQRVPLSVAQWHAHVNLCLAPPQQQQKAQHRDPRFGMEGSISTQTECEAAGGRFLPQIFGWMVHVYPMERKPEDIWSVERQHAHNE
jgi:hypothetical protein